MENEKGKISISFLVLACLSCLLLFGVVSQSQADVEVPAKRLKRLNPRCIGAVDDHPCTREQTYRQEDYLASLSNLEIADYERRAESGDADAMYLLSLIAKEMPDGKRDFPYREKWLSRAADARHPIARYLIAEIAYKRKELSDETFLKEIEMAAQSQGNGDIAWRLAFSYANPSAEEDYGVKCSGGVPRNFTFLKGDPIKALHWARIAAGKGNIMAAENLCNSFYLDTGNPSYGIPRRDATESAYWCTLAAQAMCSQRGAFSLSVLFRDGIGVPKSALEALYWKRISRERDSRTRRVPISQWEYIGGISYE